MGSKSCYFVGLDLGQASDFSALAVLERTAAEDADRPCWQFACRHLERWPLGTAYPSVVEDVATLLDRSPLSSCQLAVDRTGVGAAVVDLFRTRGLPCYLQPILITAGHAVTCADDGWHVPKRELASVLQALIQTNRLQVARTLPLAPVLVRELLDFKVKITAAGNETFEGVRDHDDLVLAVALAAWLGESSGGGSGSVFKVDRPSLQERIKQEPSHAARRGLFGLHGRT